MFQCQGQFVYDNQVMGALRGETIHLSGLGQGEAHRAEKLKRTQG